MRATVEKRRHTRPPRWRARNVFACVRISRRRNLELRHVRPSTTPLLLNSSWLSPRSSAATSIDVSLQRRKRSVSQWRTSHTESLRRMAGGGGRALRQHRNLTPVRSRRLPAAKVEMSREPTTLGSHCCATRAAPRLPPHLKPVLEVKPRPHPAGLSLC